jgi:hypothetical protein
MFKKQIFLQFFKKINQLYRDKQIEKQLMYVLPFLFHRFNRSECYNNFRWSNYTVHSVLEFLVKNLGLAP